MVRRRRDHAWSPIAAQARQAALVRLAAIASSQPSSTGARAHAQPARRHRRQPGLTPPGHDDQLYDNLIIVAAHGIRRQQHAIAVAYSRIWF